MIGLQVATSTFLAICTVVLLRSTIAASQFDPGLTTRDVLVAHVDDAAPATLEAIREAPFVLRVTSAAPGPPMVTGALTLNARPSENSAAVRVWYRAVSPEYFDVLEIPIAAGRAFTTDETRARASVAIVSESAARRFWPAQSAVGQVLRLETEDSRGTSILQKYGTTVEIIGVAADVVENVTPRGNNVPVLYFPMDQNETQRSLIIRITGNPESARQQIESIFDSLNPKSLSGVMRLQSMVNIELYPLRAGSWVAGLILAIGLLLMASGIYGVLAYIVAQRTREIGIRIALGATTKSIASLVVTQSGSVAIVAVIAGGLLAAAGTQLIRGLFVFDLRATDPLAYAGGAVIVATTVVLASLVPTWRATRVHPAETLRHD